MNEDGMNCCPPKIDKDEYEARTKALHKSRLESSFTYHAPKEGQSQKYQQLRDAAKELAFLIVDSCPDSRERALAITKLEESVMWANASIARNE